MLDIGTSPFSYYFLINFWRSGTPVHRVPECQNVNAYADRHGRQSTSYNGGGPPHSFSPSLPLQAPLTFLPPLVSHALPFNSARGSGEHCKLPSGSGQSPATKRIFGAFRGAIKRFRGHVSCMFLTNGTWRCCYKLNLPRNQAHCINSIMLTKIAHA